MFGRSLDVAYRAAIFGLKGTSLSREERAFFHDADPFGFILFARNVDTPVQVTKLCGELREAVGRDALIFIDQEGGRVQRLKPPHWPKYPAADIFLKRAGSMREAQRKAFLTSRLIAHDLRALGITADCAPVLDLPQKGADPIIGDRAYSAIPKQAIKLAHAAMAGMMCGGVAPVIKHIPGHGRAMVDSHLALPEIDTDIERLDATDFIPFKALNDAPMAMTAHITLTKVDKSHPLTLSKTGMAKIVRGKIGYDGLVMTDDLDMKALSGDLRDLASQAIAAGCDIALHCDGDMGKMIKVAEGVPRLSGKSLERARIAENCTAAPSAFDVVAARAELSDFLGEAPS